MYYNHCWHVRELSRDRKSDFLGNEFLLWLWFMVEAEGDIVTLGDDSEVTVMLSRTLALECPLGQSGSESIRSEAPTKLPEARRAIQAGKLPRQAGVWSKYWAEVQLACALALRFMEVGGESSAEISAPTTLQHFCG